MAATAAATVRPVIFLGLAIQGVPLPDTATIAQLLVPSYIAVGVAVLAARMVYRLGRRLSEARQMGSYRLIEKLGEGGMGEVWRADHEMLARPAAVKLVRKDVTESEAGAIQVQRFQREVQATAQLRSVHTIDVYDYGITDDGTFYYVMEFLDGLDLHELVSTYGPMPAPRVIPILRQACHSLAEAHEQGLIHRDIKPANIFLCRYGREVDVVKVLDFGLVKRGNGPGDRDPGLTAAGVFYGTPAYASPEMARGTLEDVNVGTDLYSLGCVAFWLLTGRLVFEADHPTGMLIKHATEKPQPPSRYARYEVPLALDQLILDCLEKDETARVPSADVMDARLAEIQPATPWSRDQARQWWENYLPTELAPEPLGVPQAACRPAAKSPAEAIVGG